MREGQTTQISFFFFSGITVKKKGKTGIFLYRENTKHIIKRGSKLVLSPGVIPRIPRGESNRAWSFGIPKIPNLARKGGYLGSSAGSALGPIHHQNLDYADPQHSQNSLPDQERTMLRGISSTIFSPRTLGKHSGKSSQGSEKCGIDPSPSIPGSRARVPPGSIPLSQPFLPRGSGVLLAALKGD